MKRLIPTAIFAVLFGSVLLLAAPALTGTPGSAQTAFGTPATSVTISSFAVTGTDRLLGVCVTWANNTTVSSVVFNTSENLTASGAVASRGTDQRAQWWQLTAPTVTTANIVVTMSAASDIQSIAALFTGVDQTTPVDGYVTANDLTTTVTNTVVSAAGDLAIDCVKTSSGTNPVVDGSQTLILQPAPNVFGWGTSYEAGAASVVMSWTTGFANWVSSAMNLNAAAGGSVRRCIGSLLGTGACR